MTPDAFADNTTPNPYNVVWRTVFHDPEDHGADWPGPWPVFLDLMSFKAYTVDSLDGTTLVKHGEELLQRFVPDSLLLNDGRVGYPGAPTVLARALVEAGTEAARTRIDPPSPWSAQAAMPKHWNDFQRHSGLAIGPGCVLWTQPRGAGFRPQTPFAHVLGAPHNLMLGCRFVPMGRSAHATLQHAHAVEAWAIRVCSFWKQTDGIQLTV